MLFSEEKVSEIIEKNDIVDVVSEYMNLKKSGSNYSSLCPFHSEKTPSFSVSSPKQIFYCFGCGVGGNVVSFIQKIERLSYVEALRLLAERAGVELARDRDPKAIKEANEKKAIYRINQEAARFFYSKLQDNRMPMQYLTGRGLSEAVIKRFGLGYAPNEWQNLLNDMSKKGFSAAALHQAGLLAKKEDAGRYYDKFRNRVMFPIIDLKGNVIAFGGRVMDDSKPKYLNSPETPVFSKGHNIYAMNFVKKVAGLENIIIVEGYMDVIALHQFGVNNAVASLGTAFTEHQAKLLKRFSNEIVIAYDSDLAGQAATLKGLAILEKAGCMVKVLSLPSGKDPDEYIRKEGLEAFKERIKKSLPLIAYKIESVKKGLDTNNLQDRIRFTKGFSEILKDIESNTEVDAYVKKYSKDMQVDETAVYAELNRLRDKNKNGNNKHNIISDKKSESKMLKGEIIAETYLLNICIYYFDKAKNIFKMIEPEDFSVDLHEKIASLIKTKSDEGKTITAGEIISCFENEEVKLQAAALFSIELPEGKSDDLMMSCIDKIKQSKNTRRIQELTEKMNALFQAGEKEQANKLFVEIIELQKLRK